MAPGTPGAPDFGLGVEPIVHRQRGIGLRQLGRDQGIDLGRRQKRGKHAPGGGTREAQTQPRAQGQQVFARRLHPAHQGTPLVEPNCQTAGLPDALDERHQMIEHDVDPRGVVLHVQADLVRQQPEGVTIARVAPHQAGTHQTDEVAVDLGSRHAGGLLEVAHTRHTAQAQERLQQGPGYLDRVDAALRSSGNG